MSTNNLPTSDKGYIYVLHFDRPISENHTCIHYVGWASNPKARIAHHRAGTGARLTQVAKERGIGFTAYVIAEGDRNLERKIKNRKNSKCECPVCNPNRKALAVL